MKTPFMIASQFRTAFSGDTSNYLRLTAWMKRHSRTDTVFFRFKETQDTEGIFLLHKIEQWYTMTVSEGHRRDRQFAGLGAHVENYLAQDGLGLAEPAKTDKISWEIYNPSAISLAPRSTGTPATGGETTPVGERTPMPERLYLVARKYYQFPGSSLCQNIHFMDEENRNGDGTHGR